MLSISPLSARITGRSRHGQEGDRSALEVPTLGMSARTPDEALVTNAPPSRRMHAGRHAAAQRGGGRNHGV
jgi:hypothetical protein